MQAIITKYCGPTNTLGTRIIAKAQAGKIIMPWSPSKDTYESHLLAAQWLARKYNWLHPNDKENFYLAGGSMPNNTGYCFVLVQQ